jgi:hypothetical protein
MPRDGAIIIGDLKFIWTGGLLQFQEEALRLNTASYRGHNDIGDLVLRFGAGTAAAASSAIASTTYSDWNRYYSAEAARSASATAPSVSIFTGLTLR